MKLLKYKEQDLKNNYGIDCFGESDPLNSHGASFYPSYCRVQVGGSTLLHTHYETEIFLIKTGKAIAIIDGIEISLKENDQLIIHPFEEHIIINDGVEVLEFFSVYSRVNEENNKLNTLILSAPPTPNGRLHLGHLSGPYLSADILKRYKLLRGENVAHYTGTDDHQSYTYRLAQSLEKPFKTLIEDFRTLIKNDLDQAAIELDDFTYPSRDITYQKYVKGKFELLINSKEVSQVVTQLPFDNHYKFEAYLEGECPQCESKTIGQCCEVCGYVGPAKNFTDMNVKKFTTSVLNLQEFRDELKEYHDGLNLNGEVYKRVQIWRENLEPFLLSTPGNIGVDNIHVWCEMAFGILLQREKFNKDTDELVYCFGIDNAFYYLILIPAIFFALKEDDKLPSKVIINDFYYLQEEKFSTSRGHALWVSDFDKKKLNYLRFYLALTRSERSIGNFDLDDFNKFYKDIRYKLETIQSIGERKIERVDLRSKDFQRFYQKTVNHIIRIENSLGKEFSLNQYAQQSLDLINDFLDYFNDNGAKVEQVANFVPLIKMVLFPMMPGLINKNDFTNTWSLDLREVENEQ